MVGRRSEEQGSFEEPQIKDGLDLTPPTPSAVMHLRHVFHGRDSILHHLQSVRALLPLLARWPGMTSTALGT